MKTDAVLTLCTINSTVAMLLVCEWEFEVKLISLEVWKATYLTNLSLDNFDNDVSGVHDETTVSDDVLSG